MKKTLSALMLCLVSIVMVSCSGKENTSSTRTPNVNVQVSESTAEWELIGSIYSYAYAPGSEKTLDSDYYGRYGKIYAKQIAGKTHFKVVGTCNNMNSPVYINPNYGSTNPREYGKYKYCFDYNNGTYYINF